MRETCARVLAAALMTGAVAFVVAMPALFGPEPDVTRPLTAPPSSLRRSVHVTALEAPADRAVERPSGAQTIANRTGPRARRPEAPRIATDRTPIGPLRPASAGRSESHPTPTPAPKPVPPSAPETETRQLAAASPTASAPEPATDNDHGHGHHKDKARQQTKQKSDRGQRSEDESCPAPSPAAEPAAPLAAPADEHDDGNGNGKAKGHDKRGDD